MKTWKATEDHLRFVETDMYGWAHNSHFLRFVENAEHELFASIGEKPMTENSGWPRVNFTVDFRNPLVFGDPYQVILILEKLSRSSITWGFTVVSGERLIAEGRMTSVQVGKDKKSFPISEELKAKFLAVFE